jgi:cation:H+ antiporter
MVIWDLAALVLSVAVLARASSVVVDKVLKLSRFFNISQVSIGLLLLAATTTLPELSVSVTSSSVGEGAIAAGNVFGSIIANILLILGAGAAIYGMRITPSNLKDIGLALLLTTLISIYIVFNSSVEQRILGFPEGVVLLIIYFAYVWHTIRRKHIDDLNGNGKVTKEEALNAFVVFVIGIFLVIASSGFVVSSAVALARQAGVAESFIGATLIAVGTSLPELSVAIAAIRKKHYGIALGNIIGANMADITLVLGTAAAINPIEVRLPVFIAALLFALIANSILFYAAAVNKRLDRLGGVVFLAIYVLFLAVIFFLQVRELGG